MQRILIIGTPGAGKSTLAIEMGNLLNLPVIHLDQEFWQPGLVKPELSDWRPKVEQLVARDRWIINGNYDSSMDIRLPRADTVIWLDFGIPTCMWRIARRVMRFRGRVRPDMADGCPESIDPTFIRFVLSFRRKIRPRIVSQIDQIFAGGNLIILKCPTDVDRYLSNLKEEYM